MDDNRFDDIIRGKVGEYEPAGFDPSALADLHQRVAAVTSIPWYTRWRTELVWGSGLILMTILLMWSQWYLNTNTIDRLNSQIAILERQNEEFDDLKREVATLRNIPVVADTIRQIEVRYQDSPLLASLSGRVKQLEAQKIRSINDKIIYLGETNQIPADVLVMLGREGLLHNEEGGSYLVLSKWDLITLERKMGWDQSSPEVSLYYPFSKEQLGDEEGRKPILIDAETLKDLDKHYSKGIGVRLGPSAEFQFGDYDLGTNEPGINLGLMADLIMSPSFSIETGVKYGQRLIEISDPEEFDKRDFPDQNEYDGDLDRIEIDTRFLEFPVMAKYRTPLNRPNLNMSLGIGFSSYLFWKQDFEYTYNNVAFNETSLDGVRSDQPQKGVHIYPGNINFEIGINKQLKERKSVQTLLFYQHGVWDVGIEKMSPNFFGLRGIYWFTVR